MAKYSLIKRWTKEEHQDILRTYPDNSAAAAAYNVHAGYGGLPPHPEDTPSWFSLLEEKHPDCIIVSRQLVRYWRSIFMDNSGSKSKANSGLAEARKLIQPSPTDDVGNTHVPEMCNRIMVIGDLHAPYTHPDAMAFLASVRDSYGPDMVIQMGDECFPPEAEILTEKGWVRFDEVEGAGYDVAQVHQDLSMSFVKPLRYVRKQATEGLLEFRTDTMVSRTTPRHNLVKQNPHTGELHRREAWDSAGSESWYIPRITKYVGGAGLPLSDAALRLLVAFQADGTFTKGAARFEFAKGRKAERLVGILDELQIPYTVHNTARETFQYYVAVRDTPVYLSKELNFDYRHLSATQLEVLAAEFEFWDGTPVKGGYRYSSAKLPNVEVVQVIAQMAGYTVSRIGENGSVHYVSVYREREKSSLKRGQRTNIPYNGEVFCVTVPTGMILVRQDGTVSVTGNCDGHAISFHDSDPNLDSAGVELEKAKIVLEELHELFPNLLVCDSNHGSLIYRRAKAHGLPIQFIKKYRDILFPEHGSPGWSWADAWVLNTPMGPVRFQHQVSGDLLLNAAHERTSMVIGHFHGRMDIKYAASSTALYFGAHSGCLIDAKSMAFAYGKLHRQRPILGCMVITDGCPQLIPMLLDSDGRWVDR